METLKDLFRARQTRSGAVFNDFIPIPVDVDLNELFEKAEEALLARSGEDSDLESEVDEGADSDLSSPPASLPPSRSSSPLPELTESEDEGEGALFEAGAFADATPIGGRNSKARKSAKQRKRRRAEEGNNHPSSKRLRADKILDAWEENVQYNFKKAPVTRNGFTARRDAGESGIPALKDLKGFDLIDWDGRVSGAITAGKEQVVLGALLGCPAGKTFQRDHRALAANIKATGERVSFSQEEQVHRRGVFSVKAHGTSFGGGQKEPRPLKHSDKTGKELDRLVASKPMQRIAHFQSKGFGGWQPTMHEHYGSTQKALLGWKPHLRRRLHFKKSVWMCLTINFGPRTLCHPHRDFGNLLYGFCAITALGNFNPDKGGHLVLRELKLVIRFPPGSTILIPSALITHYNVEIGQDEERYSVTQYTSGGIFRFVEHGFKLDADYYGSMSASEKRAAAKVNSGRWQKGLAMMSRLPALRAAAAKTKGVA